MRPVLILLPLLPALAPQAVAAVFTVQPGTAFYSAPSRSEATKLDLPEVRVHVPPLRDSQGFCLFKLVYKIADRDRAGLPQKAWARCVSTDTNVDLLIPD